MARGRKNDKFTSNRVNTINTTTPKATSRKNKEPKEGGGSHGFGEIIEDVTKAMKGGSHGFGVKEGGGNHLFGNKKEETAPKAFDDIKSTSGGKKDPTKMNRTKKEAQMSVYKAKQKADYENDKELANKWFNEMYGLEQHDIGNTGLQLKMGSAFAKDKDRRDELVRSAAIETGRTRDEIEDLYDAYKLRRQGQNLVDLADRGGVGGKAFASVGSLGTNLLSEAGALMSIGKDAKEDEFANTDSFGHIMGEITDRTREEVAKDINNGVARGAYNTLMGLGDFGVNMATASLLPGGSAVASRAVPALQATDAAEEYSRLALDNGASGKNAALTGAVAGALDYGFNRFGLDTILKQATAQSGKQVAKNVAMGALAEGGNNALQQALSMGADYALNKENSQLGAVYQAALDNGLSEEEARNEALKFLAKSSGMSGLVGGAFGGAFAGARSLRGLGDYRAEQSALEQLRLQDEQAKAQTLQNQTDSIMDLIENNNMNDLLGNNGSNTVPYLRPNNLPDDLSYSELMDAANSSKYYVEDAKALARQIRNLDNSLNSMTDLSEIQNYMSTRADLISRLNDMGYDFDDQNNLWNMEDIQNARQRARAQEEADTQDMYLQQLAGEPMFDENSRTVPHLGSTEETPSYMDIMNEVNQMPSRTELAQETAERVRNLVNNASPEDAMSGRLEQQIADMSRDLSDLGYRLNNSLELEEIPNETVNSLVDKYNKATSDRTRNKIKKQIEDEGYALVDGGDFGQARAERIDDIQSTYYRKQPTNQITNDNVNSSQNTAEDIANRYANLYSNVDDYDFMDNVENIEGYVQTMAEDISNGRDLSGYITSLEDYLDDAPDAETKASMQSMIDELKGIQARNNVPEGSLSNVNNSQNIPLEKGMTFTPGEYKEKLRNKEITREEVISKSTPAMQNALKRMSNDESVSIDELAEIPEIIYAYKRRRKGSSVEDGLLETPERQKLHEKIKEEYRTGKHSGSAKLDENGKWAYNGDVRREHKVIFITGLPASGKSSTLANPESQRFGAIILDNDDIKDMLPESDNGYGNSYVHEESKILQTYIQAEAMKNGTNIVIPIIGGDDISGLVKKIKKFTDLPEGEKYEVYICQNDLSPNKALGRAVSRYVTDGKFIPLEVLAGYGNTPQENYINLTRNGGKDYGVELSGWRRVNNDVAEGQDAIPVDQGGVYEVEGGSLSGLERTGKERGGGRGSDTSSTAGSISPSDLGIQPIDYDLTPATRSQITNNPVNNVPHMNGMIYGDGRITEGNVNPTREVPYMKPQKKNSPVSPVNPVNNEIDGTDLSQHYYTLKNSDLIRKSQSNMAMLEKSKDAGAFNKTVENRKQAQADALEDYLADKAKATERNLTREWTSGKDLDTAMLVLHDALAEGDQAKTNLILLKQAVQDTQAGRILRANRDYAGTKEGTLSKAAQYLNDQADSVLNSGRKVRDRIETMAERIINDNEYISTLDIDDTAKEMLRDTIKAGGNKEDITRMLAMYQKIGKMGVSKDAYQKLDAIYKQMDGLGLKSKKRADLELDSYKVLADDIGGQRTLRDKWDAWRYLAMLGNPKTHIRNMLGNATHYMVTEAKDNLAAVLEGIVIGNRGERTKAVLAPTDRGFVKAAYDDADNVYTDLAENGNKYNVKSEIDKARKAFGTKGMNAVNDFNTRALDWEDYRALKRKYSKSLARFLKANGADESIFSATDDASKALLDKGRAYAVDQAQQATFHEYSEMAESLSRFSNKLRNGNTGQRIAGNILEGVLPFKKTPINILKQGIKYSPISLAKALKKGIGAVSTGKFTADEVIDDLASGLTGTGIVALGAFLSSQGLLTGKANEDYDVDNAESEQGVQNYALKIGNSSYTLDWLAPFALPLFVGAELYNSFVDQGDDDVDAFDKVINGLTTIAEPVTEMSMLQGLNNVINEVSYSKENALATIAANTTLGYLTQGVPTLAGQIARSVDPYRRSTYSDEEGTFTRQLDKTVSKTLNKVPFLTPAVNAITGDSYGEPYIDYKGNPQESQGLVSSNLGSNVFTRGIDQMLSPGYYRKGEPTDLDRELNRLYEATGEQVYPEVYTGKVDGRRLSKADHTKYQTLFGQTTNELFEATYNSDAYKGLDDDQKAKVITELRTVAKDIADHDVGGKTLSSSKQKDYDLYKSEGALALIEKKIVGKVLNDNGIQNNDKNRAAYAEQGQAFIDNKTALKDAGVPTSDNATYALDNGVTADELSTLNSMTLSNGHKGDFRDYADLHKALPQVIVTPEDYKRMYDTINTFDPTTKNVGQDDLLNYLNAVDPDYYQLLLDVWFSSTKYKVVRNMDGSYSKVHL